MTDVDASAIYLTTDNMPLCGRHCRETGFSMTAVPAANWIVGAIGCVMCNTRPVEGNRCHREECGKPLHPQWPAVYCSNLCAALDSD